MKKLLKTIKAMLFFIIRYLKQQPKSFLLVLGFLIVITIGNIRYVTGPELTFSVFYLFPICMVTWLVGRKAGILLSLASAVSWFTADILMENAFFHYLIPITNVTLRLFVFIFIVYLLSWIKVELESERTLSRTDTLTGIANRRAFFELAGMEINRSRRFNRPFTIMYVDIDNFKCINDTLGHETGDRLLRVFADTVSKNIRATDIFARLGGDEFVILLPETDDNYAKVICSKLQSALNKEMEKNNWPVTFSIGVAIFKRAMDSIDDILAKADGLMYTVKATGKNMIKQEIF